MDDVLGRLSAAAAGTGFGVTGLSDGSVSVVSSDNGVVVVPDRQARTYRLEAPLPMTTESGVVHESWSQAEPGPGAPVGGPAGKKWTGRFNLTYDPTVRQWLADPSGRIDEFVRTALDPHGWRRRWTRNDRIVAACAVGLLVLFVLLWLGVTAALARAVGAPWVWAVSVVLLGAGMYLFWRSRIRRT